MSSGLHTWTVRIDRRQASREALLEELEALARTIQDLRVEVVAAEAYWAAPDQGAFRDFVAVALVSHAHLEALEVVAEELLVSFGWLIDFQR
jgi:hypothetical protein